MGEFYHWPSCQKLTETVSKHLYLLFILDHFLFISALLFFADNLQRIKDCILDIKEYTVQTTEDGT